MCVATGRSVNSPALMFLQGNIPPAFLPAQSGYRKLLPDPFRVSYQHKQFLHLPDSMVVPPTAPFKVSSAQVGLHPPPPRRKPGSPRMSGDQPSSRLLSWPARPVFLTPSAVLSPPQILTLQGKCLLVSTALQCGFIVLFY